MFKHEHDFMGRCATRALASACDAESTIVDSLCSSVMRGDLGCIQVFGSAGLLPCAAGHGSSLKHLTSTASGGVALEELRCLRGCKSEHCRQTICFCMPEYMFGLAQALHPWQDRYSCLCRLEQSRQAPNNKMLLSYHIAIILIVLACKVVRLPLYGQP